MLALAAAAQKLSPGALLRDPRYPELGLCSLLVLGMLPFLLGTETGFYFFKNTLYFVNTGWGTGVRCLWRSEDNLEESFFIFRHVGHGD